MARTFLLLSLLLLPSTWAELVIQTADHQAIASTLEQYRGAENLIDFEQAFETRVGWQRLENENGHLGLNTDVQWFRLPILNLSTASDFLLVFNNRGLNRVDGWLVQDNQLQTFALGAQLPFLSGRSYPLTRLNQQLQIEPNVPAMLYFRLTHDGYADVNALLGSAIDLLQQDSQLKALELFFYGIYLTLLMYHGILYLTSREPGYLGYCAFIAASILFFSFTEGYLWAIFSNYPNIAYTLGQGSIALMASSAALFTLQYLRMQKRYLEVLLLNSLLYMGLFVFFIRVFLPDFPILVVGGILTGITFVFIPGVAIHQHYRYRNPFAFSYFLSWSIWSVFAVITVFTVLGFNQADISSFWPSLKIAFAVQSFILAWSLGFRIRVINEERVSALAESNAKSDLIAKVSHEIRTPMNGIIGTSQLLEAHITDDDAKQLNDVIYHSGISLLTIINDLLDLSRLENGKIVLEPTTFDVKQVIGHVALTLQAQVKQKGLHYQTLYSPNVPNYIRLDTGRLRQILFNLIGNAIKYTPEGHVKVFVTHENDILTINVSDSGRGIPAEKLQAIFKPYEQVENTAKERRSGAGLGLHIAHSLISLMKGTLTITSEVGKGTDVSFSVPAPAVDAPSTQNGLAPSQPTSMTLLIADDNAINRKIIAGLANKLGHQCILAKDGAEAVNCYFEQYENIDLVLMDCEMPILDGYRAAAKLREIELAKHFPAKPIIAVTAHAYEGHLEKVQQAGMDGQISKPVTLQTLAQCINEFYYTRH